MTILLIDDDPATCDSLSAFFQTKGYTFVQASNGNTARDLALQHPISIIICSQEMWDMAGIQLCRNIREEKKDNYIYCIMLAKENKKERRLTGYLQGVDSYITHPPDLEELESLVRVGMRIAGFNPIQPAINEPEQTKIIPGQKGNAKGAENKLPVEKSPLQIKRKDISNYDILLARIALEQKLITKELLVKAFFFQKKEKVAGNLISIDEIFLEKEMIAANQVDNLRSAVKQHFGKKFAIIVPSLEPNNTNTEQQDRSIEEKISLVVCENKLEASIRLKTDNSGKITPDEIIKLLNKNNIIYGVASREKITAFLNTDFSEEKTFLVAKGTPSTLGCEASIEYHFDIDHLKAGAVNADGNIDFRERGERPRVQSGDLLATKRPMESGKPGIDINGNPIPVPDAKDIPLKCGEGVLVSENGLEVYAAIDGQPNLTLAGDVSVFAELIIDGDVDFNTGNIDFDGNVVVKGTIIDGFTIKCGNLTAQEIFGAKIVAIGDVHVSGGIIRTQIKAEGNVNAKFIMNSNIKSFGSVLVDKEVIDSKIRSSGKFIATRGKILSSFISAKMGFESMIVGSDASNPCRINVGIDDNIKKRIQEFNYTIADKRVILENLQKNYEQESKQQEAIHLKISELAQIQDHQISEQRSLNNQIEKLKQRGISNGIDTTEAKILALKTRSTALDDQLNRYFKNQEILDDKITEGLENIKNIIKEIETISDEKEAIMKWSKEERGIPVIKVKGSIFQGTKMFGIYSSIIPKKNIQNVLVKEIKNPDTDRWEMVIS